MESLEDAAFCGGAALAHLHMVTVNRAVPQALWRDRLALSATEICAGLAGRREGQAGLRDALHLTRPGDHPGPAGSILRQWSRAVARPISVVRSDVLRTIWASPRSSVPYRRTAEMRSGARLSSTVSSTRPAIWKR